MDSANNIDRLVIQFLSVYFSLNSVVSYPCVKRSRNPLSQNHKFANYRKVACVQLVANSTASETLLETRFRNPSLHNSK